MTGEECYGAWAPDDAVWSRWVRPVLFAQMDGFNLAPPASEPLADAGSAEPAPKSDLRTAVIVDLPGPAAVRAGIDLARRGYRPVPLFNGTHGPAPLIDVRPIAAELRGGAVALPRLRLRPGAPPAFLLDADRMKPDPAAGRYDNRWVVLPQDFPSGTFLRSQGIDRALLVQAAGRTPGEDLAHVLLRWKEAGITIMAADDTPDAAPRPLDVKPPALFRRAAYAVIAFFGLRRANVGGFGGVIPQQTSGSGFS